MSNRTGKKRTRNRFGPTQHSKSRTCRRCKCKFKRRRYNMLDPLYCTKPSCQEWGLAQRKMNESIARLSAPDDANMMLGIDPARLLSKSMVFGTMYGMGSVARNFKFLGQLIKSSEESITKALAKSMADLFPDSATRPKARIKNVTMQSHDEITYEIEIDEPLMGIEIEIGKVKA